jgi:hypothetical protein
VGLATGASGRRLALDGGVLLVKDLTLSCGSGSAGAAGWQARGLAYGGITLYT